MVATTGGAMSSSLHDGSSSRSSNGSRRSQVSSYRRQVSDLGMEDPVTDTRNAAKKLSKDPSEKSLDADESAESTGNTAIGDLPLVSDHETGQEASQNDEGSEGDDDFEMDLEELTCTISARSSVHSSREGSMTLKAMSDSFSSSMNCSFNTSLAELGADEINGSSWSPQVRGREQPQGGRRKPPSRTSSGYCRDMRASDSPGQTGRTLRKNIIRNSHGHSISAMTLKPRMREIQEEVVKVATIDAISVANNN